MNSTQWRCGYVQQVCAYKFLGSRSFKGKDNFFKPPYMDCQSQRLRSGVTKTRPALIKRRAHKIEGAKLRRYTTTSNRFSK